MGCKYLVGLRVPGSLVKTIIRKPEWMRKEGVDDALSY
jgi:hypothetical protein